LVVMMYIRYPLSLRNVEDLLFGSCQVNSAGSRAALSDLFRHAAAVAAAHV
jgi:hypothetical protein